MSAPRAMCGSASTAPLIPQSSVPPVDGEGGPVRRGAARPFRRTALRTFFVRLLDHRRRYSRGFYSQGVITVIYVGLRPFQLGVAIPERCPSEAAGGEACNAATGQRAAMFDAGGIRMTLNHDRHSV